MLAEWDTPPRNPSVMTRSQRVMQMPMVYSETLFFPF